MKLRHPALIRGLGFVGACLVKGLHATMHRRLDLRMSGPHPPDPRQRRRLYAFWHEHILYASQFGANVVDVLISQHADGELIAQVCRYMRLGVVRGSSKRGGSGAMLEMLRVSRRKHIAITPDGPRGPRRVVQPGIVFLASKTGLPIVPFGLGYEKAWRARSWDQFAVPYPFTAGACVVAPPIHVPADLDDRGLETYRRRVEETLHFVNDDAQRWASGLPRAPRLATFDSDDVIESAA
jgi:lysophospholipid acyltransferase (LPLAT)-like uncharacterized protein